MTRTTTLRKGAILAIVLASYTMIVLDISIVITALPKIHSTLEFSATAFSWVQNAYLLSFGGPLLRGARTGDLVGCRRMFVIGLGCSRSRPSRSARHSPKRGRSPPGPCKGAGAAILACPPWRCCRPASTMRPDAGGRAAHGGLTR